MPKNLILVSSDHIIFSQAFSESFRCSLSNFRRFVHMPSWTLWALQDLIHYGVVQGSPTFLHLRALKKLKWPRATCITSLTFIHIALISSIKLYFCTRVKLQYLKLIKNKVQENEDFSHIIMAHIISTSLNIHISVLNHHLTSISLFC